MKTPIPIRHSNQAGLTLVELLVIIAIVVVIGGFAVCPCTRRVSVKGRLTNSLNNAKQITMALRMYAEDHGGNFPANRTDGTPFASGDFSNQALEQLMPKYVSYKAVFQNKASAWCRNPAADTVPADASILKRGQNDWNYVAGLSSNSDHRWPLIATATSSATDFTYTNVKTARGGVWGGTDAIIGYPDGSAKQLFGSDKMNIKNKTKTYPMREDSRTSIFTRTPEWLGTGRVILAPE